MEKSNFPIILLETLREIFKIRLYQSGYIWVYINQRFCLIFYLLQ